MWMTCGDEFESRTNNPLAIDALVWTSQSVSYAVLQLTAGTPNPLHTHPRSSALMFLVEGSLQVGFVDSIYNLFTQTLQYNGDAQKHAVAISTFGSANAGSVSIPVTCSPPVD
ncbi:hypothetical protein CDL15_Pgr026743 [Punica granatum]|uniref:Cupin type-1 domain-containing protein n=1 Tax=Punica granatum TaxID=22663 RepID=A0A218WLE1_PUNGR|nr:hypothetical protein CDL15_Pgr026743 [Punica granatum]